MLERPHQPNEPDAVLPDIKRQEKTIASDQLLQISAQLAQLADLARDLVRPIDPLLPHET